MRWRASGRTAVADLGFEATTIPRGTPVPTPAGSPCWAASTPTAHASSSSPRSPGRTSTADSCGRRSATTSKSAPSPSWRSPPSWTTRQASPCRATSEPPTACSSTGTRMKSSKTSNDGSRSGPGFRGKTARGSRCFGTRLGKSTNLTSTHSATSLTPRRAGAVSAWRPC